MKRLWKRLTAVLSAGILALTPVCSAQAAAADEYRQQLFGMLSATCGEVCDGAGLDQLAAMDPLPLYGAVIYACQARAQLTGENAQVLDYSSLWNDSYLTYAAMEGIFTGYPDLSQPATRADFAFILSSALPDSVMPVISTIPEGSIPDVPADAWYHDAVCRLFSCGILLPNENGTDGVYFDPAAPISGRDAICIYGRAERPSQRTAVVLAPHGTFQPVPMKNLANLKSLRQKCTDQEFSEAYEKACRMMEPLAGLPEEQQLMEITYLLRMMYEEGKVSYSMSAKHYNDPYGYLCLGVASCAGCARATGLCLNILGIPFEHVNAGQYSHQWARVQVGNTYWIVDPYGLYCGPEEAPYQHPYL